MKNIMTKTLKTLAVAGMTMGLALGAQAETQDPVEYLAPVYKEIGGVTSPTNGIDHWETRSTNVYTVVSDSDAASVTWNEGWYVVANDVTINSAICTGAVHLILKDGATLTAHSTKVQLQDVYCAAINVWEDSASLTIYGQSGQSGTLNATSGSDGGTSPAAIGGVAEFGDIANGSHITINGGRVVATCLGMGAGIGGGSKGAGSYITINGGEVTATSCQGTGIGGGCGKDGSYIIINGGTLTATSGVSSAAIGGGNGGSGSNIMINGGTVKAIGGTEAAGIGGGGNGSGSNITINGGDVTAAGTDSGAGIGGGSGGAGSNITINGGTVIAKTVLSGDRNGGGPAGIGGGVGGSGSNITINGGTVTATGGTSQWGSGGGAGIGGGNYYTGSDITISGGFVTATGGDSSVAGIGNGSACDNAASNIYVNPLMTLKADGNNPPTTVIPHASITTDLASDLAGQRYATTAIDYTLVLKDGEAYKNSAEEANKITSLMAAAGLTCADNVWTMSNFTFSTSAATALQFADNKSFVINVVGTNTIQGGDSSETVDTHGMYFSCDSGSAFDVTIKGSGEAPALNVTSGKQQMGQDTYGIHTKKAKLTFENVTATFTGADTRNCSYGAEAFQDVTVGNGAKVTCTALGDYYSYGIYETQNLKVEGTGKLVASCKQASNGYMAVRAANEPDNVKAVDSEGTELTWNSTDKTYKSGATIATDVTLTANVTPVTVELPEVAGATAQLYTFYTQGGWASVATNEVPSNATVRVVYTAEDGKAFENGVYVWTSELVATESVQTAPAPAEPTAWEGNESSVTLAIDTRTVKKYFEKADILPIWYAAGAEVEVEKEGGQRTTLAKSSATTNTFAWVPAEQGTYNFSQNGFDDAQIIYTTPVEVTTNDLEVSGTTVSVTVDGAALPEDGIVASNSMVTATWTIAPGSGVYFMDGSTTYVQTFEAGKAVNPVSEAVTKPETPKAPKLKLGVVAQRYPWDGKIDVQYWAQYTPNEGYEIIVTVTLPDGTTASETKDSLSGKNWTTFDARAKFGEVQIPSGVKVTATLKTK